MFIHKVGVSLALGCKVVAEVLPLRRSWFLVYGRGKSIRGELRKKGWSVEILPVWYPIPPPKFQQHCLLVRELRIAQLAQFELFRLRVL